MVWSLILGVLLDLLAKFLEYLFGKLVKFHLEAPSPEEIAAHQNEFLDMVRWRIWLGPNRVSHASMVFQAMIQNVSRPGFKSQIGDQWESENFKNMATLACNGIKEQLL